MCVVQVEGRSWVEIACNMPVAEGLRILTDSELVQAHRKATLQFLTLNHPVDCGVCDKAGECMLQDFHFAYNGTPSISREPKVRADKFHPLSKRIVLDNERCILCSRCVRFTREISRSNALGIVQRGDHSLVRCDERHSLDDDPYSDNVIDICPVGALLSRSFFYQSRVWYLRSTPSVCPGCARGCNVDLWHRKREWKLHSLDPAHNTRIERVTPRENPAVNGPWICNKGRDLAQILERKRALEPMLKGEPVTLHAAIDAARKMIDAAKRPAALVSSWGSNEELAALKRLTGERFRAFVKQDCQPAPGERIEDDFLIRADKNPNSVGAKALFGDAPVTFDADTDLVLVWGEGTNFAELPRGARIVFLSAYLAPENGHADVFIPVSVQTERAGHYTNFRGTFSKFEPCFPRPPLVADAEGLFVALGERAKVPA
jgi:NADH-quinone oxidoreductase subunit G